jgi:hypothetical protein
VYRHNAFLDVQEQSANFVSQFLLNASLFGLLTVASLTMSASEFAALALAMRSVMFVANCLDGGLNQSSLKLAIERESWSFVAANVVLKAALFAVTIVGLILSSFLLIGQGEAVIAIAAASAAFWSTTRLVEQHARNFWRLAALNLVLCVTRIAFGGAAILTGRWMLVALAVHVAAPLPIHFATATGLIRKAVRSLRWRDALSLGVISPLMFISSLLYGALPLMTQTMLNMKADASSAAAFAIAGMFLGPLGLVAATARVYILPQVLLNHRGRLDLFGLGRKSSHVLALVLALVFFLSIGCISVVVNAIYADRLPQSATFVLIYGAFSAGTSILGLYNIGVLRGSLIRLDLGVNALRAGLTWALAWAGSLNAVEIVTWSGAILLGGELLLLGLLVLVRRGEPD